MSHRVAQTQRSNHANSIIACNSTNGSAIITAKGQRLVIMIQRKCLDWPLPARATNSNGPNCQHRRLAYTTRRRRLFSMARVPCRSVIRALGQRATAAR